MKTNIIFLPNVCITLYMWKPGSLWAFPANIQPAIYMAHVVVVTSKQKIYNLLYRYSRVIHNKLCYAHTWVLNTLLYNWNRINRIQGEQLNVNIVICVVLGLEFHLSTYVPIEYVWNGEPTYK